MTKRIGFCCKWIDRPDQVNGIKPTDECKQYNTGTTTVTWLNKQSRAVAEDRLWLLMKQNIEATKRLVERVGELDEQLRIFRIGSDLLPCYTHPDYKYFWNQGDVRDYAARSFAQVGDIARNLGVRLSFHPGAFCCLSSHDEGIVTRSIEEFEYHVDMARWMGYGSLWHDHGFKINVHIAGRQGPSGFRKALSRMTPEARNLISVENEENTHGLDACLELMDIVPTVLDIHHHWVREGEYIQPDDLRVQRVIESWRGVRPIIHYSLSREDILVDHARDVLPDRNLLIEGGCNRQKLRAHSDFYWNQASNRWALGFLDQMDIQCESKAKNLASFALYEQFKENA